jgi:hypothetical protein
MNNIEPFKKLLVDVSDTLSAQRNESASNYRTLERSLVPHVQRYLNAIEKAESLFTKLDGYPADPDLCSEIRQILSELRIFVETPPRKSDTRQGELLSYPAMSAAQANDWAVPQPHVNPLRSATTA